MSKQKRIYYDIRDDIKKYPEAVVLFIYSKRGPGKTYSVCKANMEEGHRMVYMKRTQEDIDLICSSNEYGFDSSPYAPINRDLGTNIKPKRIKKGIGGFWHFEDGEPSGLPIAFCLSVSGIGKYKGFDFSSSDWLVMDECIAQKGVRYAPGEGTLLLDLYESIARDRVDRGLPPLKMICLANSDDIVSPLAEELEIVDLLADLNASGESHYYDDKRKILIHHITNEECPITEESRKQGLQVVMDGTAWAEKTYEGKFSNNDFTNVVKLSIKKMRCMYHIHYKNNDWYIWLHPAQGIWYMCKTAGRYIKSYDLNRENEQAAFYNEEYYKLRDALWGDRFKFSSYSMYNIFNNYKKYFC